MSSRYVMRKRQQGRAYNRAAVARSAKNIAVQALSKATQVEKRGRVQHYGSQPFTASKTVTMEYMDQFTLTNTAGAYAEQVFNLNSIFDPDRTGTGHQPYSRDAYATLYNRYRVNKISYEVQAVGTAASAVAIMSIVPNNESSTIGDTRLALESPLSKGGILTANANVLHKFKGSIQLAKLTGVSQEKYDADDTYSAVFSTNPSEVIVLHVGSSRPDGVTTGSLFTIKIKYNVTMYDPIELSLS